MQSKNVPPPVELRMGGLNPTPEPTKIERTQRVVARSESWLTKHAGSVAAFLGGVIVGAVVG